MGRYVINGGVHGWWIAYGDGKSISGIKYLWRDGCLHTRAFDTSGIVTKGRKLTQGVWETREDAENFLARFFETDTEFTCDLAWARSSLNQIMHEGRVFGRVKVKYDTDGKKVEEPADQQENKRYDALMNSLF